MFWEGGIQTKLVWTTASGVFHRCHHLSPKTRRGGGGNIGGRVQTQSKLGGCFRPHELLSTTSVKLSPADGRNGPWRPSCCRATRTWRRSPFGTGDRSLHYIYWLNIPEPVTCCRRCFAKKGLSRWRQRKGEFAWGYCCVCVTHSIPSLSSNKGMLRTIGMIQLAGNTTCSIISVCF